MSEFSDNACDSVGVEQFANLQQPEQVMDAENNVGDATEIELLKKFVTLCLEHTVTDNKRVEQLITYEQNRSSVILDEKMRLLTRLTIPIENKVFTVEHIINIQGKLLEQFHKLFKSEKEYLRAYDAHCNKVICANKEINNTAGYDEYTEMDGITLADVIDNVRKAHSDLDGVCADKIVKFELERQESEAKYKSLLKEIETFESYYQMAIDYMEQLKFKSEMRLRAEKLQIK
ncbi:uncharacterized protein LOC6565643 [Drosophila grimshawi]|uniref:GH24655 n=1 Tax=Drosophila grimshawi TaxID=7222 RepID=B4JMN0_DROGR|nr:uncharacterized protein LOC6565643 [Drosophila grimshawi]EDV91973.1 GH24655 [Drosophila grimshawi]